MNRKISFLILGLLLVSLLINSGHLTMATKGKIKPAYDDYLKAYNISFLIKADLNNDGKEEKVTLLRQWDGEGWYSNDQWYVMYIFDDDHNVLYEKDISYFQEVESFAVKDSDGDGLKEIIIALNPTKYWSPKTYTYEWHNNAYDLISK